MNDARRGNGDSSFKKINKSLMLSVLCSVCCSECWVICSKIYPLRKITERVLVSCQWGAAVLDSCHGNTLSLISLEGNALKITASDSSLWLDIKWYPNIQFVSLYVVFLRSSSVEYTFPGLHGKSILRAWNSLMVQLLFRKNKRH